MTIDLIVLFFKKVYIKKYTKNIIKNISSVINIERIAMTHSDKFVFFKSMFLGCNPQIISGCTPMLISERECSPMNTNWFFAFDLFVDEYCVFRVEMLRFQQLPWFVGSNRNDTQVKPTKDFSQFLENSTIPGIARIKYFISFGSLDNKSTPQSFSLIKHASSRPMTNRNKCNLIFFPIDYKSFCVSPIKFVNVSFVWETVPGLKTNDKNWIKYFVKFIDWTVVHMVVMIVADHDQVDFWKLANLAWDFSEPFWTNAL